MANKYIHIALCWLLLANLLFISTGLEFCHHDDCHEHTELEAEGLKITNVENDSCLACSIDLFHELYFEEITQISFFPDYLNTFQFNSESDLFIRLLVHSGRAPPLS